MRNHYKIFFIFAIITLLGIFTGNSLTAQIKTSPAQVKANNWTGKIIWVVDVNTNEYYKAPISQTLIDLLPQFMPGAVICQVIIAEKGNPFFLLEEEDYPTAVITSLAVCELTSKNVANFASEARKKGIPSVMINIVDVHTTMANWNKKYRNPARSVIEIEQLPQTQQEATEIIKRAMPLIIKAMKN